MFIHIYIYLSVCAYMHMCTCVYLSYLVLLICVQGLTSQDWITYQGAYSWKRLILLLPGFPHPDWLVNWRNQYAHTIQATLLWRIHRYSFRSCLADTVLQQASQSLALAISLQFSLSLGYKAMTQVFELGLRPQSVVLCTLTSCEFL